jgi:hypothetical protein
MTGPGGRGYNDALSLIRNGAEDLAIALAIWEARDETGADAHARHAASGAVDAIDAMLRALHAIRASDDATAVRVDKLLAESADAMTTSSDQASQRVGRARENRRPERCERPGPSER